MTIDTHEGYKQLIEAGVPEPQAEATVRVRLRRAPPLAENLIHVHAQTGQMVRCGPLSGSEAAVIDVLPVFEPEHHHLPPLGVDDPVFRHARGGVILTFLT